jgi:hypothetical protein
MTEAWGHRSLRKTANRTALTTTGRFPRASSSGAGKNTTRRMSGAALSSRLTYWKVKVEHHAPNSEAGAAEILNIPKNLA